MKSISNTAARADHHRRMVLLAGQPKSAPLHSTEDGRGMVTSFADSDLASSVDVGGGEEELLRIDVQRLHGLPGTWQARLGAAAAVLIFAA